VGFLSLKANAIAAAYQTVSSSLFISHPAIQCCILKAADSIVEQTTEKSWKCFVKTNREKLEATFCSFDDRLMITFQTHISSIGKPNFER
jgi:hypothetical protein